MGIGDGRWLSIVILAKYVYWLEIMCCFSQLGLHPMATDRMPTLPQFISILQNDKITPVPLHLFLLPTLSSQNVPTSVNLN
jgi:hypothetical protein